MNGLVTRRRFIKMLISAVAVVVGSTWTRAGESARADAPGIAGRVTDLLTGKPLAGVSVRIAPDGPATTTDADGCYRLVAGPGVYDVKADLSGYISMTAAQRRVEADGPTSVDYKMVLANPTEDQQRVIESRLEVPTSFPQSEPAARGVATAAVTTVPATIRVLKPDNTVVTMDFEEYLRGVVPSEVFVTWHREALRAQAVAARSYAACQVAHPKHADRGADVCTTGCCQAWNNIYYGSTDAAVSDTRGVVCTYSGSIIDALFFAQCNGASTLDSEDAISWQTCQTLGWNYVGYLRARTCGGHGRYSGSPCGYHGHGVGMCQWGAKAKADSGKSYRAILSEYYTGIAITEVSGTAPQLLAPSNGDLALVNTIVEFRWTGTGGPYCLEIRRDAPNGQLAARYSGLSGSSQTVMLAEARTYYWRVQAGGTQGPWSESRELVVVTTIFKNYVPVVSKNAQ